MSNITKFGVLYFTSFYNLVLKQRSQTRGPRDTCGPQTSGKMKILKEILTQLSYVKNIEY
jgi:hypothetical protein